MSSIKREISVERKLDNEKLIKTRKYIKSVSESNEEYLKRKINWGINEIRKGEGAITRYKLQVKCGITCYRTEDIKELIDNVISDEIANVSEKNIL